MREVQDHYFRQAKEEGYLSRAAYKLIEIDERKHILRKGARALDCGCAPGSWLQVASRGVGEQGAVVGVDLLPIRRKIAANVHVIADDFTTIDPVELLRATDDDSRLFDVILSDMAPSTSGNPEADHFRSVRLCEAVLDRCPTLLRVGGNVVMKVFEGAAYMEFVKRAQGSFKRAKGFKPKASRSESTEMYLIAEGWRGVAAAETDERPRDVNVLAPPKPTPNPGWGGRRA